MKSIKKFSMDSTDELIYYEGAKFAQPCECSCDSQCETNCWSTCGGNETALLFDTTEGMLTGKADQWTDPHIHPGT